MAGEGVFLDHDERYELTDEFLNIWRQLFTEEESGFTRRLFTN